jgi:protein ImuA
VAAVLAWLPQARVGELRRLQLAAAQHEALLFVLRPAAAAASTSPARLRLQLLGARDDPGRLDVHILKRRGPPLAAPVSLPARSERMATLLAASRLRRKWRRAQQGLPAAAEGATVVHIDFHQEQRHALDRLAMAA